MKIYRKKDETVEEQNLPSLNVSLACELFQAESIQGTKDSGRNFDLSP